MSKRTRALILAALLAAMNLAGLTAVAHAQANHDPDGKDARRLATERQAGEPRRHGQVASPEQATADAALRRVLARERFSIPSETPEQPTAPAPPEPSAQPNWLLASLGGFAAGLALAGGLAVLAARRAGRSARIPLPATSWSPTLPAAAASCPCAGWAGSLERITWPLTVGHHLRKRRVA